MYMGLRVQGLGFGVQIQDVGESLGCRVGGLRVQALRFRFGLQTLRPAHQASTETVRV